MDTYGFDTYGLDTFDLETYAEDTLGSALSASGLDDAALDSMALHFADSGLDGYAFRPPEYVSPQPLMDWSAGGPQPPPHMVW